MAQIDPPSDAIVGDWLTIPEVAERLDLPVSRVKQYLRDRRLLGALVFLASAESDFVTGQTLSVDGGNVNT